MSRWITAFVVLTLGLFPAGAAEQPIKPDGKLIVDRWESVYLEGAKSGFLHTTVEELDRKGQKVLQTTLDMHVTVKRFNQVLQLESQTGTEETPDGKVVGTFIRQVLGTNKEQIIVGLVKGKQLELLVDGKANVMKPAPWNDKVIGLYRQDSLLSDKKMQPGDSFEFLTFEPVVNLVVSMKVAAKGHEEVDLEGQKKAKLLRVEFTPEKLEGIQLPKLVAWVDEDRHPLRQDSEIPGLGKISMYRTTREVALAPAAGSKLTDIGLSQFIKLNKKILRPYDTTSAVYRITIKGDENAAAAFLQNDRQQVINAKGSSFELKIKAGKSVKKAVAETRPGDEFTQSSYFITSDDPRVKELARKAVGRETDPWKKALLIEKWVKANMRSTSTEAMATADHVARTLQGDCTEYAMLMAAMCRAEGIPAKTDIGLIYTDTKNGPSLGFHMWTEVWAMGQWIGLDATLGHGYVGATHLKVTDSSWHDTRSLTPLLPLIRVLGKMQVEVISVQ